jgi:hypothetical protein
MKKLFLLLSIVCLAAFAEASFDQIETLIEKQQYSAAASGLEGIIANHPNSAKAYYAMAQAQAGMGNQEKARFALNKARGIDPELKFAPASSVQNLEAAITPQVKKIEPVHEKDYTWLKWLLALGVFVLAVWYYNSEKAKKEELEAKLAEKEREKAAAEARAARASTSAQSTAYVQPEAPKWTDVQKPAPVGNPAPAAPVAAPAQSTVYVQPAPTQTVVHHHTSSNDGLVTGMVLGQMMSNNHHDTTRIVEREVIREVPAAPSRDSSWDTPAPSRSSSWDSDSSSSSSSSWGSSSSSSSDSSWSSSSDSSSSWD